MGRWGPQPAHARLWGAVRLQPCQFRTDAWRGAAFSGLPAADTGVAYVSSNRESWNVLGRVHKDNLWCTLPVTSFPILASCNMEHQIMGYSNLSKIHRLFRPVWSQKFMRAHAAKHDSKT